MNIQRGLKPSYNATTRRHMRVKRLLVGLMVMLGLCACCVVLTAIGMGQ